MTTVNQNQATIDEAAITELHHEALRIEGKARVRVLRAPDYADFLHLCRTYPNAKRIRVYSSDGFVPNSYPGKTVITCLERTVNELGEYDYVVKRVSALRPHGIGKLRVIEK